MISKHVEMRDTASGGPNAIIKYLTDDQGKKSRIEDIFISNCVSIDPAGVILEMETTQHQNIRVQGNKMYHLVISFPPGEVPTKAQLRTIEYEICKSIGYEKHQRIAVVHHDTDCLHIQVAINKVNPETFNCYTPKGDYWKMQKCRENLEKMFGLQPGYTLIRSDETNRHRANDMEKFSGNQSMVGWLRRTRKDDFLEAKSWAEFDEILESCGLYALNSGGGMVISDGKIHIKFSSIDNELSCNNLKKKWGEIPQKLKDRWDALAAQSESEDNSLALPSDTRSNEGKKDSGAYITQEVVEAIKGAKDWEEIHGICNRAGIKLRVKGNGLAFVTPKGDIKASSVDREFSKAKLEGKLGIFQNDPFATKIKRDRDEYKKAPEGYDKNEMYAKYQEWRDNLSTSVRNERQELREMYQKRMALAKEVYRTSKIVAGKNYLERRTKLYEYQAQMAQVKIDYRKGLADIRERYKKVTWLDWLKRTAMSNSEDSEKAIIALRARAKGIAWKNTAALSGSGTPQTVYDQNFTIDNITRNGTVIYEVGEELVRDNGIHFDCSGGTKEQTLIAVLQMAKRRWGDQLEITGDEIFKRNVVKAAVKATITGQLKGGIEFKDQNFENLKNEKLNIKKEQNINTADNNLSENKIYSGRN